MFYQLSKFKSCVQKINLKSNQIFPTSLGFLVKGVKSDVDRVLSLKSDRKR